MLRSRPIRLAVNLCLIGALLLSHNGFGTAIASTCQTTASTSTKCSGCGHCAVDGEGARCGCRKKQGHTPATEKQHSQHKGCCSKKSVADETNHQSHSSDVGACLCGQGSLPAVPASQSRVDIKQVLKLAPKPRSTSLSLDAYTPSRASAGRSQPLFLMPHASQRLLCSWLI